MNSSVIVFPGSNCDRDIAVALKKLQFKTSMIWHKETELPKSDLIVIPGGFLILNKEKAREVEGGLDLENEIKNIITKQTNDQLDKLSNIYINKLKKNIQINEI